MKCVCGSTEFEERDGNQVCVKCGRVQHAANIVSNLSFSDQNVLGKFGKKGGEYSRIKSIWGISRDADEIRLSKAFKLIGHLSSVLNLPKYITESAERLYKLAQSKNWVQGRHTSHVVAAAIYIVCRKEKTPHLLIDFSDALQVNLYTLGSCYLKLIKFLHFDMPVIDPSLFIHRFCDKLEFGDKLPQVSMTALRLLQRMKRDWMCHGRRPTGLVGAAILIAARYHGFKRTTNQIVQTVHVCDETIRKRLVEFKQTSVAKLTREEFEKLDLENDIKEECDPPAFRRAVRMKEILKISSYEKEMADKKKMIEQGIESAGDGLAGEDGGEEKEEGDLWEVDDDEIRQSLLTKEESALKSIIWHNMHKDWLEEQELKEKKKSMKATKGVRRKKKVREMVDAPDAVSALMHHSKIGSKLNSVALSHLFNGSGPGIDGDKVEKRLKVEAPPRLALRREESLNDDQVKGNALLASIKFDV